MGMKKCKRAISEQVPGSRASPCLWDELGKEHAVCSCPPPPLCTLQGDVEKPTGGAMQCTQRRAEKRGEFPGGRRPESSSAMWRCDVGHKSSKVLGFCFYFHKMRERIPHRITVGFIVTNMHIDNNT